MIRTTCALLAFAMLCAGCIHPVTIPDQRIPHRVADPAKVKVWVRNADGSLTKQEVLLQPGWWIASPTVVE